MTMNPPTCKSCTSCRSCWYAGVSVAVKLPWYVVNRSCPTFSADEKVGQLLFTTYHGSFTATDTPAYQQLLHDVQDLHVGGFIVITHGSPLGIVKSQAYPSAVLANQLQAKSKLPLLIGADFERGTSM